MAEINLPSSSLLSGEEINIKKLRNYLTSLSAELEYALSNIDADNISPKLKESILKAENSEKVALNILESLNMNSGKNPDGGGVLSIGDISFAFGSVSTSFEESKEIIGTATTTIDMKETPDASSLTVGFIKQYDSFDIHKIENSWAHLTYKGKTGYAPLTFIQTKTLISSDEESAITVPFKIRFLDNYVVILTAEGEGNFEVVLNKKSKDYFIATIYRNPDAPKSASINWLAIGIRK